MAWPYDTDSYSSPQLSGMFSNNFGLQGLNLGNQASGAQNLASLTAATGASTGNVASAATPGMFQGLSDIWNGSGFFGKNQMLGGTDATTGIATKGWAPVALGIGQSILGGIQGAQATKLANAQLKESKRQFNLNYDTQRQSMNTAMEDRQRARVASNPNAYQSVSEYMAANRIN